MLPVLSYKEKELTFLFCWHVHCTLYLIWFLLLWNRVLGQPLSLCTMITDLWILEWSPVLADAVLDSCGENIMLYFVQRCVRWIPTQVQFHILRWEGSYGRFEWPHLRFVEIEPWPSIACQHGTIKLSWTGSAATNLIHFTVGEAGRPVITGHSPCL